MRTPIHTQWTPQQDAYWLLMLLENTMSQQQAQGRAMAGKPSGNEADTQIELGKGARRPTVPPAKTSPNRLVLPQPALIDLDGRRQR